MLAQRVCGVEPFSVTLPLLYNIKETAGAPLGPRQDFVPRSDDFFFGGVFPIEKDALLMVPGAWPAR